MAGAVASLVACTSLPDGSFRPVGETGGVPHTAFSSKMLTERGAALPHGDAMEAALDIVIRRGAAPVEIAGADFAAHRVTVDGQQFFVLRDRSRPERPQPYRDFTDDVTTRAAAISGCRAAQTWRVSTNGADQFFGEDGAVESLTEDSKRRRRTGDDPASPKNDLIIAGATIVLGLLVHAARFTGDYVVALDCEEARPPSRS